VQCSSICDKCVEVCPNRANYTYLTSPAQWLLPQLACQGGDLKVVGSESFAVAQGRQILHVDDFCNECGNCATFCVHQGKPYAEKPRLFLQESDFALEADNAFHMHENTLLRREGGRESRLSRQDGLLVYENEALCAQLSPDFQVRKLTLKQPFPGTISLRQAAEMAVILDGVQKSLGFLVK
jgi:putative selenate reductase